MWTFNLVLWTAVVTRLWNYLFRIETCLKGLCYKPSRIFVIKEHLHRVYTLYICLQLCLLSCRAENHRNDAQTCTLCLKSCHSLCTSESFAQSLLTNPTSPANISRVEWIAPCKEQSQKYFQTRYSMLISFMYRSSIRYRIQKFLWTVF